MKPKRCAIVSAGDAKAANAVPTSVAQCRKSCLETSPHSLEEQEASEFSPAIPSVRSDARFALETELERYACSARSTWSCLLASKRHQTSLPGKASLAAVRRNRWTGQPAGPLPTRPTGGGCVTKHRHCCSTRAAASCRSKEAARRSRWTSRRAKRTRIWAHARPAFSRGPSPRGNENWTECGQRLAVTSRRRV